MLFNVHNAPFSSLWLEGLLRKLILKRPVQLCCRMPSFLWICRTVSSWSDAGWTFLAGHYIAYVGSSVPHSKQEAYNISLSHIDDKFNVLVTGGGWPDGFTIEESFPFLYMQTESVRSLLHWKKREGGNKVVFWLLHWEAHFSFDPHVEPQQSRSKADGWGRGAALLQVSLFWLNGSASLAKLFPQKPACRK